MGRKPTPKPPRKPAKKMQMGGMATSGRKVDPESAQGRLRALQARMKPMVPDPNFENPMAQARAAAARLRSNPMVPDPNFENPMAQARAAIQKLRGAPKGGSLEAPFGATSGMKRGGKVKRKK
jgi:hypothetical protein